MITLSFLQVAHPVFQQAMQTIWNAPMLDAQASYTAHRIREKVAKADKEIADMRTTLLDKYGKKDAEGKLIVDAQGWVAFENKEDNEKFETEFQEAFGAKVINLKVTKLNFQSLAPVRGITTMMWPHLIPIVDGLPAEEPEESEEDDSALASAAEPSPAKEAKA